MAAPDRPMTALDHLRKLLAKGPIVEGSAWDYCFWCEAEFPNDTAHAPNCPWLAAKGFIEDQDRCLPEYEMVSISPDGTTIHAATRKANR